MAVVHKRRSVTSTRVGHKEAEVLILAKISGMLQPAYLEMQTFHCLTRAQNLIIIFNWYHTCMSN